MGLAVAYCRVSTKKQEEALKDHKEQWNEIFEQEGYEFANTGIFYKKNGHREECKGLYIDEGISAKEYQKYRKAFSKMIEDGKNGKFNQIFVEDVTRFARNVEDGMKVIKDLREKNVNVYFRKEKLNSRDVKNDMVLGVLFSVAENEITTDSRRLKWKMERLHKAGKWTAPAPYGYTVNKGELSTNDEEMGKIDLIFYLYTEKLLGMRSIANYFNKQGWRTRKGQLWKSTEIRYILKNKIYIGDIINHKTESVDITRGTIRKIPEREQIVVHNEKLRIIDDEIWRRKEIIMEQRNNKLKDREGYSNKHLLSTLLYCQQCGSTYIRVKKRKAKDESGNKVDRGYEWTCLGHNHYGDIKCKGRFALDEQELIKFIIEELEEEKKRNNERFLDIYLKKKKEQIAKINIEKIQKEKEEMQNQIFEVRADRNKSLISNETYEEQIQAINKRIDEIRIIEKNYYNLKLDIKKAKDTYEKQKKILNNLDYKKMTNTDLKIIFNKIIVCGKYDKGYKNIHLHFSYNFLDEIREKLPRKEVIEFLEEIQKETGIKINNIEQSFIMFYKPYQKQKIRKSTYTTYLKKNSEK